MLIKNIKKTIEYKHQGFVNSIKDEKVRGLVNNNSIITGGAITSLLLNEQVNDYDYYFTSKETCLEVAKYFVNMFIENHPKCKIKPEIIEKDNRIKIFIQSVGEIETLTNNDINKEDDYNGEETSYSTSSDKCKYSPVYLSSNAITLSDKKTEKIQIIIRFFGSPKEIHKNYDFIHCTNYWYSGTRTLHLNQKALECILTKELVYQGSLYPLSSIIRTRKFIQRGWWINAGQILKMIFQVGKLDLTDVNILEEQLTGVDVAYFNELIYFIKEKQKEDENFILDIPYIVELVDKIFQ